MQELSSEMKTKLLRILQAQRARKLEIMNKKSTNDHKGFAHEVQRENKNGQGGHMQDQGKCLDASGGRLSKLGASRSRDEESSQRDHKEARDIAKGKTASGRIKTWNGTKTSIGLFTAEFAV